MPSSITKFISRFKEKISNTSKNLRNAILNYRESYRNGVAKFGVWWKIFQLSMWSLVLIFFITAALILIFYIPKLEMLL